MLGQSGEQRPSAINPGKLQAFEEEESLKRKAHEAEMSRRAAIQDLDLGAEVRRRQAILDLELQHEQRILQMRQKFPALSNTRSVYDVVVKVEPLSPVGQQS